MFNVDDTSANARPSQFDFLVLGSPVIYHKLMFHKWVARNINSLCDRPAILFSVSGAPAGPKLDGWIARSLPSKLIEHMHHVVLLGRQNPKELTWWDRIMLIIGGLTNSDPAARREELKGFDYMDRASIKPVVDLVRHYQRSGAALAS